MTIKKNIFHHYLYSFLLVSILVTSMFGCASTSFKKDNTIFITDATRVPIPPSSAFTEALASYEYLEGSYNDQDFSFNAALQVDQGTFSLTLLSLMGQTVATLQYDENGVTFTSAFIPVKRFRAEYVISDIQFCYLPLDTLKAWYDPYGITISEQDGIRSISEGDQKLYTIIYGPSVIDLENHLRSYHYHIEELH